jgi:16S rRNA U516 pseudouridylate synthase RsuA-like enzyme
VTQLHREAIGAIELGSLPKGQFRPLTKDEVKKLKNVS